MTPVASVIIAAHHAAAFVHEALHSALVQTRADIEVIAVDDGSTDGTWEVIVAAAKRDPRVVPLRRARCGGPAAARNEAIAKARGRWLAVLDADDLFLPGRVERLVAMAEAAGADLMADNLLQQDFATGALLGSRLPDAAMTRPGPVPLLEMVRRDLPDTPLHERFGYLQPIMRRDFLAHHGLRYAEDIRAGEDFLLYFECMAAGARFHLTPETHYVYRLRQGSVSTGHSVSFHPSIYQGAANRCMLRTAVKRLRDRKLASLLHLRQRRFDADCFGWALEQGRIGTALRYAPGAEPSLVLRHLRVVAGAVRRRLGARIAPRQDVRGHLGPTPGPIRRDQMYQGAELMDENGAGTRDGSPGLKRLAMGCLSGARRLGGRVLAAAGLRAAPAYERPPTPPPARHQTTMSTEYFDALYAAKPDPWGFTTSPYEAEKYAATLAALPRPHYATALEVGCSIGVLTAQLAPRCRQRLLAVDAAAAPLTAARERCATFPQVEIRQARVPEQWPEERYELILISELLYFFTVEDLSRLAAQVAATLEPGGDLVLVHWTGPSEFPLTGDEAVEGFRAALGSTVVSLRQNQAEQYRMDVLRRAG